jgi:ABC-type taurine transport system ATPase subunit
MMIFQEPALFPWLAIFQNIEIALKLIKIPKVQREQIVIHYLEVVGLSNYSTSFINFLVV